MVSATHDCTYCIDYSILKYIASVIYSLPGSNYHMLFKQMKGKGEQRDMCISRALNFLQEDFSGIAIHCLGFFYKMAITKYYIFITNCVYKINEFRQWFVKEYNIVH